MTSRMRIYRPREFAERYGIRRSIKRRRQSQHKQKRKLQRVILTYEDLKRAIDSKVLYLREGVDKDCIVYPIPRERTFRGRFSVTKDFENDDDVVGLRIEKLERLGERDSIGRIKKQVNYTIYRRKEDPPFEAGVEYSLLEKVIEEHGKVNKIRIVLE